MTALSVTVSGETPAEVATRLRSLANALTRPSPADVVRGGLPHVPSSPAPRLCSVHHVALTLDEWTSKAGKACKAWRCPDSTASTACEIEWAS